MKDPIFKKIKNDKLNIVLTEIQNKPNLGRGRKDRKPSPTFAYELTHGKKLKGWRGGKFPGNVRSKLWNDIEVDKPLKDKWLKELNSIKDIEVRGSCAGHAEDWVSFIAFRITDENIQNDKNKLDQIVKYMNQFKNTYCGYDIGMQGRPRFVCATSLYYSKDNLIEWTDWWDKLSKRLNKAISKVK